MNTIENGYVLWGVRNIEESLERPSQRRRKLGALYILLSSWTDESVSGMDYGAQDPEGANEYEEPFEKSFAWR
jgi:hypothetical protein